MQRTPPVLLCLLVLHASACGDSTGPDYASGGIAIDVPASTSAGRTFPITVRALRDDGQTTDTRARGRVTLSVSAGGITPANIEMADGTASIDAKISGVTGPITVHASLSGKSASATLNVAIAENRLPGSDDGAANAAIPDVAFTPRAEDYGTDHPELTGLFVSFNTVLIALSADGTVAQVNAALDAVDAQIVGGIPGSAAHSGILYVRLPTTTHVEMETALETLRATSAIDVAVQDALMFGDDLPRNDGTPFEGWTWESEPTGGNWMLELARVPQAWSLKPAIEKTRGTELRIPTGIVDDGFDAAHEDLNGRFAVAPSGAAEDHGTSVSSIIAASWGNGTGIDGVNPFATLYPSTAFLSVSRSSGLTAIATSVGGALQSRLHDLIVAHPELRVINVSQGFNWHELPVNVVPSRNATSRRLVDEYGSLMQVMLTGLAADGIALPVIVVSAGNNSGGPAGVQDARYNSPMANAAVRGLARNIIVVEALMQNPPPAVIPFPGSDRGGHVSAGGFLIRVATRGNNYAFKDGTSFAAAFVTGLVGYLHAIDPSLPRPTLTSNPVLDILLVSAVPVTGAAPRVDAYAAALLLDSRAGADIVLSRLLDIDDGTEDGNLRLDPVSLAEVMVDDLDGDGGIGDGTVDMSDFRRWRDWLLQLEGIALDGSASHIKKDVNGDGAAESVTAEQVFPRGDFNGDGMLSRTATHPMPGALGGGSFTDLQVLQQRFSDPRHSAASLDGLIDSGDLHVDAGNCLNGDIVTVHTLLALGEESPGAQRTHDNAGPVQLYTVPATNGGMPVRLTIEARNEAGENVLELQQDTTVRIGQDVVWDVRCRGVFIAQRNAEVMEGTTREFSATVVGVEDQAVTWSATGGDIDQAGNYTAGTESGFYRVIARSVQDPSLADSVDVRVFPPPFEGQYAFLITFEGGLTGVDTLRLDLERTGSSVTGTWRLATFGFEGNWSGSVSGLEMTFSAVLVDDFCSGSGSGVMSYSQEGLVGDGTGSGTCEGAASFTFTIGSSIPGG